MAGCQSAPTSDAPAKRVRPIDKVREELVGLKDQLNANIVTIEAIPAASSARAAHQNLTREIAKTDALVATLRTSVKELDERATDYLAAWGGEVDYIGTSGAPQVGTNVPRQQAKARYDRMVGSLMKARDAAAPLRSSVTTLEQKLAGGMSAAQLQALKPDVDRIFSEAKVSITHVQEAIAALDELKANAPK